ncbi:LysE family transporter [Pleomorphomonas oryzae]|uniref:LysE family transporter n=1 Tax=Pleomorphomonas oryzae TaxID=261934 RepID=UPI0003F685EE|nr:LysE family transporter [Pleomorphomonas oryzae]
MSTLALFATIAVIHLLAVASPGPTLMVVMSQSVAGSRRSGFLVVAGVVLATLVWSSVTAAGLGGVIARFGWLYFGLKLVGAVYLSWLAWGLLKGVVQRKAVGLDASRPVLSGPRALRAGFLTTISNPKVAAYYASLFGVVIPASAPTAVFAGAILTAVLVSVAWWSAVVLLFALPAVQRAYARARRWMDAVMGALLLALAGRLLFSR